MKRYKSSGSSLFLLEIMVNILLFAVLLTICLQFFIKAHNLTNKTTELQRATTLCSSIASLYEAGDGGLDLIDEAYPNSVILDGHMILYLDQDFITCNLDDAVYIITISNGENEDRIRSIDITCSTGDREIYSITAKHYTQLHVAEGGQP